MLCLKGKKSSLSAAFSLSKKSFRQAEASFCNFKKLQKLIDLTRKTPLLGFFRNYLPSRIRTLFVFFGNLKSYPADTPRTSTLFTYGLTISA